MSKPIIIVGTGVAGYTLAKELRKLDTTIPLVLISADNGESYPKPMLSNALTKGKTAEQIQLASAEKMADTLNASILTQLSVLEINRQSHTITLDNNNTLEYEKLILATGASPRTLRFDGDASDEMISINSLQDYYHFRQKLEQVKHVTIIGPGLIGCEFANDLLNININVSIIGPSALPMTHLLPNAFSEQLMRSLTEIGADWQLNHQITSINKQASGYEITLDNGQHIQTDLIISSAGLIANTDLARAANLLTNKGIVVDNEMKTSDDAIYALGDCAEINGQLHMYIAPILASARALAKTLTGTATQAIYPVMPIIVKTPAYPIVIFPAPLECKGEWHIETDEQLTGLVARFIDHDNQLRGFALSEDAVKLKQHYVKQLTV